MSLALRIIWLAFLFPPYKIYINNSCRMDHRSQASPSHILTAHLHTANIFAYVEYLSIFVKIYIAHHVYSLYYYIRYVFKLSRPSV